MILNKSGKGFLLLLIVIIVSLAICAGVYFLYYQEKNRNGELTAELSAAQAKVTQLQGQLDEASSKVVGLQDKITKLAADLDTERQQKTATADQIAQLQQELTQQKALKEEIEKKLGDADGQLKTLNSRVKEMETQLKDAEAVRTELEAKVKTYEVKSNVELGKIVVSQEEGTAPAAAASPAVKSLEGKILVVNKDYNFAVLNLGNKDGVAVGNIFTVYRGAKSVAELKIEKVHDAMSAAGFAPEIKSKIAEGDRVELKTK